MNNKSISFTSFTESIMSDLKKKLGSDYTVFSHTVKKNNGVELTGVAARKSGCNTSPSVYINELYHENMTCEEAKSAAEQVYMALKKAEVAEDIDFSGFSEYEKVKKRVVVKLINAGKNKELLEQVPHMLFHDLALVVYYPVRELPFEGKAIVLIRHSHREAWKVETEELLKVAISNTPRLFPGKIESMESVMRQLFSSDLEEGSVEKELVELGICGEDEIPLYLGAKAGVPMYVLSNEQKLYGAVCMLYPDILKKFTKKIDQDCYILPSSVHEVILVPAGAIANEGELKETVTDINRTQVAEDEILADSVYYYSRCNDKIIMI